MRRRPLQPARRAARERGRSGRGSTTPSRRACACRCGSSRSPSRGLLVGLEARRQAPRRQLGVRAGKRDVVPAGDLQPGVPRRAGQRPPRRTTSRTCGNRSRTMAAVRSGPADDHDHLERRRDLLVTTERTVRAIRLLVVARDDDRRQHRGAEVEAVEIECGRARDLPGSRAPAAPAGAALPGRGPPAARAGAGVARLESSPGRPRAYLANRARRRRGGEACQVLDAHVVLTQRRAGSGGDRHEVQAARREAAARPSARRGGRPRGRRGRSATRSSIIRKTRKP